MKDALCSFAAILDRRCTVLGEVSAHSFLLRIMAIAAAIAFGGFETLYRGNGLIAESNWVLLGLALFGSCSFVGILSVFVMYLLGRSLEPSVSKVHHTSLSIPPFFKQFLFNQQ
jgi:hypothetical protein